MKKTFLLPFLLLITLFLASSVSAYFPLYHYDLTKRVCETYQGSGELARTCCNDPELFKYMAAGANLADITVVKYLEQLGAYDATHSYDYCKAMFNAGDKSIQYQCFALGNCLHSVEDTTPHNDIVPYAITHTLLPNLIIHAPVEYKIDRWAIKSHGASYLEMQQSLEVARCNREDSTQPNYDPSGDTTTQCKLIHKMQIALTSTKEGGNVDAYALAHWYIKSVVTDDTANQGVYTAGTGAYMNAIPWSYKLALFIILAFFTSIGIAMIKMQKKGWFVKIFLGIAFLIWVLVIFGVIAIITNHVYTFFLVAIYPLSIIAPVGDIATYDTTTIQNIHGFFDYGEAYIPTMLSSSCSNPPCTPSGFNGGGIERADRVVSIVWIFILVIIFAIFLFMITKTFGITLNSFRRKGGRRR